jgi:hypothetical protein
MHSIGKTNVVANRYVRKEVLRPIRSDGFEPEITFCINVLAKGNVASANDPATRTKVQARSFK